MDPDDCDFLGRPVTGEPVHVESYDWRRRRWVPFSSRRRRRGVRLTDDVPVPLWLLALILLMGCVQLGVAGMLLLT